MCRTMYEQINRWMIGYAENNILTYFYMSCFTPSASAFPLSSGVGDFTKSVLPHPFWSLVCHFRFLGAGDDLSDILAEF